MEAFGFFVVAVLYLLCAGSALALGGWLLARRRERGPAVGGEAAALALTACWALASLGLGPFAHATAALLSLTYFAWLWTLYRLFSHDDRDKSMAQIRPVVLALGFVELMQLVLLAVQSGSPNAAPAIMGFEATLRSLFCIGALVLAHNLYPRAAQ